VLGAGLLRRRGRLGSRWRHRPGDHLSERRPADLARAFLDPVEAERLHAHGKESAAVLVPLFGWPERPGLIFTERRRDMRRHAGEISFPGGRADPGETLVECALREAREEIGLDPGAVEVVGALPPTSTVVTSFKVLPVVGLVPQRLAHTLSPHEVERVIELDLDALRHGFGMRRLIRRGVPFRTPTYDVEGAFIWGATARMLQQFLERLDG
jgi:8-oxo-dGTP pyrophosphatase MutT (NUDIX family)